MSSEQRRDKRELSYAKIWVEEDQVPGYVHDMAKGGCRIEIPVPVEWQKGERKAIKVIPEDELEIPSFALVIEIRWFETEQIYCSAGVKVVEPIGNDVREHYEKLLAYYEENRSET